MAAGKALARRHVAADNNCLFTTFAYLCEGLTSELDLRAAARRLRAACADAVLADPDPATRALLLGHDNVAAYSAWIRVETHWGGEPEVLMLAEHYHVELVLASCETLRCATYAAPAAASRVYVMYTGQHYDPLVVPGVGDGASEELRKLPLDVPSDELEASAVEIAREHNAETERRRKERRVRRLRCGGCGVVVADNAAFQAHCGEVEHDDDFTYECEQVDVVIGEGEAMPDGHVELQSDAVHAFYNALQADKLSLSMRCSLAPFKLRGVTYPTLEARIGSDEVPWAGHALPSGASSAWLGRARACRWVGDPPPPGTRPYPTRRAARIQVVELPSAERRESVLEAVRAQFGGEDAAACGLRAYLLSTADQLLACIDLNPWLGIQAAGGISTGENQLGKALMAVRSELRDTEARGAPLAIPLAAGAKSRGAP